MSNLGQFAKEGMLYKGVYAAGTSYRWNNVVVYGTKTYVCKVASSIGVLPTNTANWAVLAESAEIVATTIGSGTNPTSFVLQASGSTITLNKVS